MSDPHHKPHVHETAPLHDPIDEWHDHSKDEKPQHAHAEVGNAFQIMGIGIGLFMVIVFAVVVTYAFYMQQSTQRLNEMEVVRPTGGAALPPALEARKFKGDNMLQMQDYGWIEVPALGDTPARNLVRHPIDAAKQKVAQDYSR